MNEPETISVWLIEGHAPYRRAMKRALERTPGMSCPRSFGNCEDAVAALAVAPPPRSFCWISTCPA